MGVQVETVPQEFAWASVLGRLAHDFPQIVGVNIDDFSDSLDRAFNSDNIAEIESRIRSQAPSALSSAERRLDSPGAYRLRGFLGKF
jgi:hypothetical protein